jgi:peroxiredoxin
MHTATRQGLALLVLIAILGAGCGKPSDSNRPKRLKESTDSPVEKSDPKATPPVAKPDAPPPLQMPEVRLPASLLATCRVKTGDAMPEVELPSLDGKRLSLASVRGEKLTVVLFWTGENPYSTKALEDVGREIAAPYAKKGVRIVGVNEKDRLDDAQKAAKEAQVAFPNLSDADGAYFGKVATSRLPRLYLLDAAGKILWFDLEYSTTTQRQLLTAIKFQLGEKP